MCLALHASLVTATGDGDGRHGFNLRMQCVRGGDVRDVLSIARIVGDVEYGMGPACVCVKERDNIVSAVVVRPEDCMLLCEMMLLLGLNEMMMLRGMLVGWRTAVGMM